ncbi:MAG: PilZ domain-containing protein [Cellvibrionaceae bacterium]|nr:PilZ domain-containing protein [Cellvibrionaceae bacterium]
MAQITRNGQARERRCHYRVDDRLLFEFKLIDPKTMRQQAPASLFMAAADSQFKRELDRLDQEGKTLLRGIAGRDHSLAIYLALLNHKISLIAAQLTTPGQQQLAAINLSEGGLAFYHPSPLHSGDHLAIALRSQTEDWQCQLYGRIVRSRAAAPQGYKVAVAFCALDASQQQLLTRRVLKVQMRSHKPVHTDTIAGRE